MRAMRIKYPVLLPNLLKDFEQLSFVSARKMQETGEIHISLDDRGADGWIRVQLRERVIVC